MQQDIGTYGYIQHKSTIVQSVGRGRFDERASEREVEGVTESVASTKKLVRWVFRNLWSESV
jgi:hypothetical protein